MEDAQPNEVRLARKGSSSIPRVRVTRQPYRRPPHNTGPSRWQPPPAPPHNIRSEENGLVVVEAHLPPECYKGEPWSHGAREAWMKDQKRYLETSRRLSVVSFDYLDDYRKALFTCRARQEVSLQRQISLPPAKPLHPPTHKATGLHPVNVHSGTNIIRSTRQGAMAPMTKARYQSSVPQAGPSRISIGPSFPVQPTNTNPLPAHQVPARAAFPAKNVIDIVSQSSVEEECSTRWSTFRSGHMDICLPSLSSGSRLSSSETETVRLPYIDQPPAQGGVQPEGIPVDSCSDSDANIRASDSVPVPTTKDHQASGYFADHVRNVVRSSCSRGHSAFPEGESETLSSPIPGHTLPCEIVTLSLGSFDKPRRLLNNDGFTYIVTAHGIIDQLGSNSMLKWDRNIISPSSPFEEFVDDACILSHQGEPVIVLGHAREQNQISLLNLGLGWVPRPIALRRDWNTSKKCGVSAVTSLMSPLKFASGGYDHRVHIWDIAQDLSGASAVELAIKHSSTIYSLLPILDSSHKLLSAGVDRNLSIYDLSAERVVKSTKLSCFPSHLHRTNFEFCTLLEVSHLETQFEVRDYRTPLQAVARFGFIMEERRGRYDKADTWSHLVACGDRDGAVRFWDLRNVSKEVAIQQRFNDPVTQVVHIGPRWLACSKRNEFAYIDFPGG